MKYYPRLILNAGPVAYYRLGERSGTTAVDSSGNGHDGTYTGGYTLGQAGAINSDNDAAVTLDGTGYVDCGSPVDLQVVEGTAEAWVYPTTANDGTLGAGIVSYGHSYAIGTIGFYLERRSGNFAFGYADNFGYQETVNAGSLPLNTWSHVAATWTAGLGAKAYVNAVLGASFGNRTVVYDATAKCLIGRRDTDNNIDLTGSIDEVAIYSRALSAAEILGHYKAGIAELFPASGINRSQLLK